MSNFPNRDYYEIVDQGQYGSSVGHGTHRAVANLPKGPLDQYGRAVVIDLPRPLKRVGRNEPCPCGSGKKFKHCHLKGK